MPRVSALHLGRPLEEETLRAQLRALPVVLVTGEAGIGKTTLLSHALRDRRPLRFTVQPEDGPLEVLLHLLHGLARSTDGRPPDAHWFVADHEERLNAFVALTAQLDCVLVLEDLHEGRSEAILDLVFELQERAPTTRWVVTSREEPTSALLPVLRLLPFDDESMRQLAARLRPNLEEAQRTRAAEYARGIPWRLLRAVAALSSGLDPERARALEPLDPSERRLIEALSHIEVPLPADVLMRVAGAPLDVERLQRTGLLEATGDGLRVPPIAQSLLEEAEPAAGSWAEQLAVRLEAEGSPAAVVAALSLYLAREKEVEAAQLLERHGEALLSSGYGGALTKTHRQFQTAAMERWRTWALVEMGDVASLSRVAPPPVDDPSATLLFSRALAVQGDLAAAIALDCRVAETARARGDRPLLSRASLAAAEKLRLQGKHAEALTSLAECEEDETNTTRIRLLEAACRSRLGDAARAAELISGLDVDRVLTLDIDSAAMLAGLHVDLGDLEGGARIYERATDRLASQTLSHFTERGRRLWYGLAAALIDGGELPRGRQVLARLSRFAGPSTYWGPMLRATTAKLRLFEGDFDGLPRELEELFVLATKAERAELATYVAGLILRVAVFTGGADHALRLVSSHAFGGVMHKSVELYHTALRIELGDEAPSINPEAYARWPALSMLARSIAAEQLAFAGDLPRATQLLEEVISEARRRGYRPRQVEALCLLLDLAILSNATGLLEGTLESLTALETTYRSARLSADLEFYHVVLGSSGAPAQLARIAERSQVAPVSARRARALLAGSDAALHERDRRVVAAILARWSQWWISPATNEARLPSGKRVDFSRRPLLLRILTTLADAGGRATKEQLYRSAWGANVYHPLQHDNTIQVSIRKLRLEIEDDPKAPQRLITTEEGYALQGHALVRH
jgi:tetratricopeptide (TPR) repeat protein